ncbi:unnamed protein product [Urochloa humidicola]
MALLPPRAPSAAAQDHWSAVGEFLGFAAARYDAHCRSASDCRRRAPPLRPGAAPHRRTTRLARGQVLGGAAGRGMGARVGLHAGSHRGRAGLRRGAGLGAGGAGPRPRRRSRGWALVEQGMGAGGAGPRPCRPPPRSRAVVALGRRRGEERDGRETEERNGSGAAPPPKF